MLDARFRRWSGGVTSLGPHILWCPKYPKGLLGGRAAQRLNRMLDEIAAENAWRIVPSEVMPGHVHTFVRVRATDLRAEVARKFKGRTSRQLRAEFPWLAPGKVLWSKAYFAASVGYVSEETPRRYIEHQWVDAARGELTSSASLRRPSGTSPWASASRHTGNGTTQPSNGACMPVGCTTRAGTSTLATVSAKRFSDPGGVGRRSTPTSMSPATSLGLDWPVRGHKRPEKKPAASAVREVTANTSQQCYLDAPGGGPCYTPKALC